jgi:hypothetical protein
MAVFYVHQRVVPGKANKVAQRFPHNAPLVLIAASIIVIHFLYTMEVLTFVAPKPRVTPPLFVHYYSREAIDIISVPHAVPAASPYRILTVVAARELLIGCHSFEEYLSPRFETLFVFDTDFVELWSLRAWMHTLTPTQTLAAHLAVVRKHKGEFAARRFALSWALAAARFKFMFAVNCDMHAIPPGRPLHVPFDEIASTLASSLQLERKLAARGETALCASDEVALRASPLPLLAIAPLMFDEAPLDVAGRGAALHGDDYGHLVRDLALANRSAVRPGFPFMYLADPVTIRPWFEVHAIMYDIDLLSAVVGTLFHLELPQVLADQQAHPLIAGTCGLALARHNEVALVFDRARHGMDLQRTFYNDVNMDTLLQLNFIMLANFMSARKTYEDFFNFGAATGVSLVYMWHGFVQESLPKAQVPTKAVVGRRASDALVRRVIVASAALTGYYPIPKADSVLRLEMPEVYPFTLHVTQDTGFHKFLSLRMPDGSLRSFYTNHNGVPGSTLDDIRCLAKEARSFEVPALAIVEYFDTTLDASFPVVDMTRAQLEAHDTRWRYPC